jgi:hypothetical protein
LLFRTAALSYRDAGPVARCQRDGELERRVGEEADDRCCSEAARSPPRSRRWRRRPRPAAVGMPWRRPWAAAEKHAEEKVHVLAVSHPALASASVAAAVLRPRRLTSLWTWTAHAAAKTRSQMPMASVYWIASLLRWCCEERMASTAPRTSGIGHRTDRARTGAARQAGVAARPGHRGVRPSSPATGRTWLAPLLAPRRRSPLASRGTVPPRDAQTRTGRLVECLGNMRILPSLTVPRRNRGRRKFS